MHTNAAIYVTGLAVERGGRTVLAGLDLTVGPGELVGLLGPSGCGKSTLIRSLAGVQVVKSGSVTVLGSPAGSAANRAKVAYVTQASSVYPDLSVEENLQYFAAVSGTDTATLEATMAVVELDEHRKKLTGSLSGGQRARVSLAAALLARPQLYLLDEPTVGLDPVLRRELWALFKRLAADGATLLISSHVMDEASRCDRVLLMRSGTLIADATPQELLASTNTASMEDAFLTFAEHDGRAAR